MKKGDRVLLAWSSANRDPKQFENPDEVDIRRWPNRHMAFGLGVHRCAGSHLGRAMAKEMLSQILDADGRLRRRRVGALEPYPQQGTNNGWMQHPGHVHARPARAARARRHPKPIPSY